VGRDVGHDAEHEHPGEPERDGEREVMGQPPAGEMHEECTIRPALAAAIAKARPGPPSR